MERQSVHVGQKWDTYDVAPYNLFNVIWRGRNWVLQNVEDRPPESGPTP